VIRASCFIATLGLLLAACTVPPTSVPVTLTAPVPSATPEPISLAPVVAIGSRYVYADGTTLVAVPNGEFIMGHGAADNPEHRVFLSDFWIFSTEVTNQQYALCVGQGLCAPPDPADNPAFMSLAELNKPVVGVTHDQAAAYCRFIGADLPSEAQWEKAARGAEALAYPWGHAAPSCDLLNFANCTGQADDVTGKPEGGSPYGALNMAGNVYEWVADWYDAVYYVSSPHGDPPGPPDGRARVVRSSGYRSTADQSLAYSRSYSAPSDHRPDLGFRCAVGDVSHFAPACSIASTVDSNQMASSTVECPEISIDVKVTACRFGGGAVVTFNNDNARDPNASFGGIVGCKLISGQPGTYPLSYECRQASTAVMSSSCVYSGIPAGSCPRDYTRDSASGLCHWNGGRTLGIDCPAGEFYDPIAHCCRVTTGNIVDFPVCPPGSVFTETNREAYACLPSSGARPAPTLTEAINPPVCGDRCELTVEICSVRNLVFCPTTCACLAVGRKCPDP